MSREKQIELLEKQLAFWKHHCTVLSNALTKEEEISNHYAEMLDKTEEELNAERVKQEWISVDDRLPEQTGKYLVFTYNRRIYIGDFIDHYCDGNAQFDDYKVTHWMPLPEAPKMKGGE